LLETLLKSLLITLVATGVTVGLAAVSPADASAQALDGGCDDEGANKDDAGSFRKVERGGEVVYEFTGTIRVCGKVPKPNVIVILLERNVGYEWEKLKQQFLPKIHESLKGAPF
jgi:hypothetical protein